MEILTSEIVLYGGINQIGGNKILIKDSEESLFFDFGVSYEDRRKFFAEYLKPRSSKGIGDYLFFNLIPNLPYLYRDDLISPTGHEQGESDIKGVFITHPHMDHFGYIPFIREDVPIFASELTIKIIESYETISKGGIESEFCSLKKRPYGFNIHHSQWEECSREFNTWDKYNGTIKVDFFDLDHSVWGAGGYIIEASDMNIVYTGDLRQHGVRGYLTKQSLKKLEERDIDILIIEGTNVGNETEEDFLKNLIEELMGKTLEEKINSEQILKEKALRIVQETNNPVFIDFSLRDFDRLKTFYDVAKNSGRKLVIPLKLAQHIYDLSDDMGIKLEDNNLRIYQEPKKMGSFRRSEYSKWERDFLNFPNVVKFDEVKDNLDKFIMVMDYFRLGNLIDLKPSNGIYIHSETEPFNEEQAIDFKRHLQWIKFFNLDYHYLHTSGHMSEEEIFRTIESLSPKYIIPIHTKGIEKFRNKFKNIILPKMGESIQLKDIKDKVDRPIKKDLYSFF